MGQINYAPPSVRCSCFLTSANINGEACKLENKDMRVPATSARKLPDGLVLHWMSLCVCVCLCFRGIPSQAETLGSQVEDYSEL